MRKTILMGLIAALAMGFGSCEKDISKKLTYYEVGVKHTPEEWRDSSFVVATRNPELIKQIEEELKRPVTQRRFVFGRLVAGNPGYNRNGSHRFKWHLKEDEWQLAEMGIEIYDGRPYSDVDQNFNYWMTKMKRFGPWGSYIKRRISGPAGSR